MISCESVEVLCRYVCSHPCDISAKPFVGEVVSQFDVGNLPVCRILYFAVAEQVVPSQCGAVGKIGTGDVAHVCAAVPLVGVEDIDILVAVAVAGVQLVETW